MMIPSQWSISCWIISAVKPVKLLVEPAHLYRAVAPSLAGADERQAALLGLICARLLYNLGVEHDLKFALVVKGDDALAHADHVRRHAHAAVLVGDERVEKILRRDPRHPPHRPFEREIPRPCKFHKSSLSAPITPSLPHTARQINTLKTMRQARAVRLSFFQRS